MKLEVLFKEAINFGILNDPRPKEKVKSFPDSAILYAKGSVNVKKILVGIDIESAEIILADAIRKKSGLDLVLSHHPEGYALANLAEVMSVQVDLLRQKGIKDSVALKFLQERQNEVERRLSPANHTRCVDTARILDIPFICLHTVADNHVFSFLDKLLNAKKKQKLSDIMDILMRIPEYRIASGRKLGPSILLGDRNRPAGKIMIEMTGGTEGPKDIYPELYKKGVRTLVCMHLGEDHFKKVRDLNMNVIIAGHIASDVLGLNLLLDNIERKAKEHFEIIQCSGFYRVKRNAAHR
ncbi:MAG: NGG1p interacting factor NIF3 [Candidatus Omnitrophica bacterium]|jgi:putative NIF3 family GTP cyclohydrolase 1 type 2|nr:NGG1p interacting factor NIF3 [Candidatus Omnitrophota bacterium]